MSYLHTPKQKDRRLLNFPLKMASIFWFPRFFSCWLFRHVPVWIKKDHHHYQSLSFIITVIIGETRIQYSIDSSTKMALRFLTLRTKHVGHWSKSTRRTGSEDKLQVGSEDNASANADITQHIVSFPAECNLEKTRFLLLQLRHYESERENVFTWNVWNQIVFRRCSEHYPPLPLGWSVCFFEFMSPSILRRWLEYVNITSRFLFFRSHHSVVQPYNFWDESAQRERQDEFLGANDFPTVAEDRVIDRIFFANNLVVVSNIFYFHP